MKPAPFAYVRAASLDQVFDLLARHGDEARAVRRRQPDPDAESSLSAPAALIDIKGAGELAESAAEGGIPARLAAEKA